MRRVQQRGKRSRGCVLRLHIGVVKLQIHDADAIRERTNEVFGPEEIQGCGQHRESLLSRMLILIAQAGEEAIARIGGRDI